MVFLWFSSVFFWFSYGFLGFETSGKPEENRKKTKRKPKENQKKTEENRRKPEEKKTTAPPPKRARRATRLVALSIHNPMHNPPLSLCSLCLLLVFRSAKHTQQQTPAFSHRRPISTTRLSYTSRTSQPPSSGSFSQRTSNITMCQALSLEYS